MANACDFPLVMRNWGFSNRDMGTTITKMDGAGPPDPSASILPSSDSSTTAMRLGLPNSGAKSGTALPFQALHGLGISTALFH